MSGSKKPRRPAHQNKFAFRHNKNSKKTRQILALPNQGLCAACTKIIEWRKRYRKYKPITQPAVCLHCHQRNVVRSYHVMCDNCAAERGCCAKCQSVGEVVPVDTSGPNDEDPEAVAEMEKLAAMKERERRTYFRQQRRELRARRIAERQARAAAEGVVLTDADAAKAIVLEAKEARARRVAAGEVVDEDDDDDDLDDFDIDDDDDDDEEDDEEDEDEEEQDEDENDIDDAADADHEDDENENPF